MNIILKNILFNYNFCEQNIVNIINEYINEIYKGDIYNIIDEYKNLYKPYYNEHMCNYEININKMIIIVNEQNINYDINSPILLCENNGIKWEYLFVNDNPKRIILLFYVDYYKLLLYNLINIFILMLYSFFTYYNEYIEYHVYDINSDDITDLFNQTIHEYIIDNYNKK